MATSKGNDVPRFISAMMNELYPTSKGRKKAAGEYTLDAIARDLGVTKPQVVSALAGPHGIGPKFETQFAKKHFGASVDKLRLAALKWGEQHPLADETLRDAAKSLEAVSDMLAAPVDSPEPDAVARLRQAVATLTKRLDALPHATTRRPKP